MTAIGISFVAFFVTIIGGLFGVCYLAHRFEPQAEWLLDKWWGFPTVFLGGVAGILGLAIAVASIVGAVL